MTTLNDIKQGIITRTQFVLGSTYKPFPHVEDIAANNWNQVTKGFAVKSVSGNETSGVNKAYTMSHSYEVAISDQFVENKVSDTKLVAVKETLLGFCLDIYKDLINTNAGVPASVMNVLGLSLSEIEVDDEAKVVVQRMRFNIIYRIIL